VEVLPQISHENSAVSVGPPQADWIELTDGTTCDLAVLDPQQLHELHWREEQVLARRIAEAPRGSAERDEAVAKAYDTIARILTARHRDCGQPLKMGFDARYERLVLELLGRQQKQGATPALFEVGFGAGVLLGAVAERGFDVAGIEVSGELRAQACMVVEPRHHANLLVGDVRSLPAEHHGRYSLVFWNDVFEHIPPDEIAEYLAAIRALLAPNGLLATITPNWHFRPSDITRDFLPRRSEPKGLHLKEYTLREVTALLRTAGFNRVGVPLYLTRQRIVLRGSGLAGLKRLCEPLLEWLPFRPAEILCRGFGLNCTIAAID